jgi:glucose-6-phosphate isomerase
VIWGINSYDQWGVELGKQLAGRLLSEFDGEPGGRHDCSTTAMVQRFRKRLAGEG